jgi:hypothetical protein
MLHHQPLLSHFGYIAIVIHASDGVNAPLRHFDVS